MSTNRDGCQPPPLDAGSEGDALIERIRTLPEPEALRCYAGLSPGLQWIARQRATGPRRTALSVFHAISIANCK